MINISYLFPTYFRNRVCTAFDEFLTLYKQILPPTTSTKSLASRIPFSLISWGLWSSWIALVCDQNIFKDNLSPLSLQNFRFIMQWNGWDSCIFVNYVWHRHFSGVALVPNALCILYESRTSRNFGFVQLFFGYTNETCSLIIGFSLLC